MSATTDPPSRQSMVQALNRVGYRLEVVDFTNARVFDSTGYICSRGSLNDIWDWFVSNHQKAG